ncbi:MAG TPA: hypothetical protein VFL63_02190 [Rhodanobacteraceae bacterium]|jgi:hypothetical protein|nr:hypothetical protein [Rhodanobacteraceae bacterium]
MSRNRFFILSAACLLLASCSTDLKGPQVFQLPGFSVKGLSDIHFGESCPHILGAAHAAGYGRNEQDDKTAKAGEIMMLTHIVVPPLGEIAMYFHCSKEHNTVTQVDFQTGGASDGAPSGFDEIKEKLIDVWGQPGNRGSRVEDTDFGQNAQSYRMVGLQPPPTRTRVGYAEWDNGSVKYQLQEESIFGSMVVRLQIMPNAGK